MYKWRNLTFSKTLYNARYVSKAELVSAIDLFSGGVLLWFKSIKNHVNDCDSLAKMLHSEFLPSDYDDRLWDEIRNHT